MTRPQGIDVSLYQGDISNALKGCSFCFAKVSEAGFTDPKFAAHLADMKAAGVVTGGYHYLQPQIAGAVQAAFFLGACADVQILALDYEAESLGHPTVAREFIAHVKAHDKRPIVLYASEGNWPGNLGQTASWVANWSHEPKIEWTFWQKQGSPLDRDEYNGTLAELRLFARKPAGPPPPPITTAPALNLFPRTLLSYVVELPEGTVLYASGKPHTTIAAPTKLALLGATGTHFCVADGDYGVWVARAGLTPEATETPVSVGK